MLQLNGKLAAWLCLACFCAAPAIASPVDAPSQERAAQLIQNGMYFYWNGGDIKKAEKTFFQGITLKGRFDVVEASFRDAIKLMPERLDLRYDLASALIAQKKLPEALQVYRDIQAMDDKNFDATVLVAAYSLAAGNDEAAKNALDDLRKRRPERTQAFQDKFARVSDVLKMPIQTSNPDTAQPDEQRAIVVLGYALGKDGSMQPTLQKRLLKTLELARAYPQATLVLSGGVAQGGVTESYVMSRWLQEQGIARERLRLEDQSRDTVDNALNSCALLQQQSIKRVTLVTSASHVRRGMTLLQEACRDRGLELEYDSLVDMDFPSQEAAQQVSDAERLAIYRDLMRVSGLWAFPGIQR